MLSFLNTVAAASNGKSGPTGNTSKSASSGDTSGEDSKKLLNGDRGGRKRKKEKLPTAVTKIAKIAVPASTNRLQPIDIIIPKTLEDEEKILEIPKMDSPLFKDIPSKKVESSSDLSSSSGGSSSSGDSSSSDDDSDEEGEEKKDTNTSINAQLPESVEEPAKLRNPIKLTISNLGKPSATVVSTASRTFCESNSSDTDLDGNDTKEDTNAQENSAFSGDANRSLGNSRIIDEYGHRRAQGELLHNVQHGSHTNVRCTDTGELEENNSRWKDVTRVVDNIEATVKNNDLVKTFLVFNFPESDNSDVKSLTINHLDVSSPEEDSCSKDATENGSTTFKDILNAFTTRDKETELIITKHHHDEFVSKDTADVPLCTTKKLFSGKDKCIKPKLNSASLRDSCETKYCPDGFILSPTLGKSLQHLEATTRISPNSTSTVQAKDMKDNGTIETGLFSKINAVREMEKLIPSDDSCKHATLGNSIQQLMGNREQNVLNEIPCSPTNTDQGNMAVQKKSNQIFVTETSDISEIEDQNPNTDTRERNERNLDASLVAAKVDEHACGIIHTKITKARLSGSNCKDNTASSQALLRNTATKLPTLLTTTTANTGSILSPSSEHTTKNNGFTNGIPDSKNPFITWTKFDDDFVSVNAALPASSLVQSLARVPFPSLALPGEPSISQISPLGVAVPQLSPLALAGLSPVCGKLPMMSPGIQMPMLASPNSQGLRSSPSHGGVRQPLSPPVSQPSRERSNAMDAHDGKVKSAHKSVKRTSRLSNIIDSLRTSKEKQAAGSCQMPGEPSKRSSRKSPSSLESSSFTGHKSSSSSSSPVFSSLVSDSDKLYCDSLGYPLQINADARHMIRSSLDVARAQNIDKSFTALNDDLDRGKRMLESLDVMKNGLLDPYSKPGLSDSKLRKMDSSHSQHRSKSSFFSSTPLTSAPSLSSRPSSRQSTKSSIQAYSSASPSSSSRTSTTTTSSSNNPSGGSGASINSSMFHVAPSTGLDAAHMELNAAAANILTFQQMYGIQDPYMMKTLMSNPLYLQRMMEYQKQAMDPLMLRQLEMFEAAAVAAESSKNNKEQQAAAMNAHSILWQAHAASILQHQQMQQIQQYQLHHHQQQQQLHQQVAAARERETRETIAAIMANKNNSMSTPSNKPSGSISTGQSAKSLTAPSSAALSSSSASASLTSPKWPRSAVTPSTAGIYSRDAHSLEKKFRPSHQNPSHSYNMSSSSTTSPSSFRHGQMPSKSSSSNNTKPHSSNSASNNQLKHDFLDLSGALHLSASPQMWGFPALLQPSSVDMANMSQFFERAGDAPSSSLSGRPADLEATGTEVLDLSVKPRTGKT